MISLRPYQQKIVDDARFLFTKRHRSVLCVCATGGGKSYIFMDMCVRAAQKGRVLILAHRIELIEQHEENFLKNGVPLDNIVIASVQSVYLHPEKYRDIYMVVADECHLFKARTFEAVLQSFRDGGSFIVGFTATPVRLSGESLRSIFDTMVVGPGTRELIEMGCLAPYDYLCPATADISQLKKRAGDYAVEDIEQIMDGTIYGKAVEEYKHHGADRQGVAFCCSIEHSKALAQQFRDAGIPAEHMDGEVPKKQRHEIMERFRAGEIRVLCNVNLISEGLSVDGISVVMLLRPTLSLALYLQQVGRGLRYEPGKVCTILDFVGNVHKHGLPDEEREWSLDAALRHRKEFNEDGSLTLRVCDFCYKCYEAPARHCPFCQTEYTPKPRELQMMEQVRLEKLDKERFEAERVRKAQVAVDIRNARSYEDFLAIAIRNGYKNPKYWARMRAHLRGYDKQTKER